MIPRFALLCAFAVATGGCKDATPPQGIQTSHLSKISVEAGQKLLLTYFAPGEGFKTVNTLSEVPSGHRGWVRVVDLQVKPQHRQDLELVYVADLRKAGKNGAYPYVVMSRRAFEAAAQARVRGGATATAAPTAAHGQVILYATAWCPACRQARKWLQEKRIAYVEKDIEKDRSAARELMIKAQRAGVSASGVPVLDVRGTLVRGFDPRRITALLGAKKK